MKTRNIPLAVYVEKTSLIHRLRPSWKLVLIVTFIIAASIVVTTPARGLMACGIATVFYLIAKVPPHLAFSQLWPPLMILIPLAAFQWWARDFCYAAAMFLSIFASMMVAFLLTLTSTIDAIMDSIEHTLNPLKRIGFPVDTVTLAMALTIRLIPLMFTTVGDVLEARKARGAGVSIAAFGTPVLIRSLKRARAIAEALEARGVGD